MSWQGLTKSKACVKTLLRRLPPNPPDLCGTVCQKSVLVNPGQQEARLSAQECLIFLRIINLMFSVLLLSLSLWAQIVPLNTALCYPNGTSGHWFWMCIRKSQKPQTSLIPSKSIPQFCMTLMDSGHGLLSKFCLQSTGCAIEIMQGGGFWRIRDSPQ